MPWSFLLTCHPVCLQIKVPGAIPSSKPHSHSVFRIINLLSYCRRMRNIVVRYTFYISACTKILRTTYLLFLNLPTKNLSIPFTSQEKNSHTKETTAMQHCYVVLMV